jgi:hypothetical protein
MLDKGPTTELYAQALIFFEIGAHYVAQANLKHQIFLPLPPMLRLQTGTTMPSATVTY